jgi:anti-sigma B factor antagonist
MTGEGAAPEMLRLKCFNCGLAIAYEGSDAGYCPRCVSRHNQAVQLITVSDQPSSKAPHTIGRLRVTAREHEGSHTLALQGELDIASAPMLEGTVEDICAQAPKELILDMTAVEFVDSSGLNAILRGKALCEERGCEFCLSPAQRPVERVFEVTRLIDRLPLRKAKGGRGEPTPAPGEGAPGAAEE